MAEQDPNAIAGKLLAEGFARSGPKAEQLSDPIEDTPMVVTLDQLRPYDLNPRVTRNPRYDDLKASIRERGLDAPPAITRRPGESTYTIRNGGNTRLAILNELWRDTKEERYFRITCLFRPWSARGEIIALTGHLTENELHGGLSFIERALGIEKVRELYEAEGGQSLSQSELSRRLTADGYPVSQSHISRMQDTIRYLLPAIPTLLYAGLGRPQTERLTTLRKAGERVWSTYTAKDTGVDFTTLFQEVLTLFDHAGDEFPLQRIQDELIGQMGHVLNVDYDTLALAIDSSAHRQRTLEAPPPDTSGLPHNSDQPVVPKTPVSPDINHLSQPVANPHIDEDDPRSTKPFGQSKAADTPAASANPAEYTPDEARAADNEIPEESLPSTTDRLQSIQRLVAEQTGERLPEPINAGADTHSPLTETGDTESSLGSTDQLRITIGELAATIASEIGESGRVSPVSTGIGFTCRHDGTAPDDVLPDTPSHPLFSLLSAMETCICADRPAVQSASIAGIVRSLLGDWFHTDQESIHHLSDTGLDRLFQLFRLARQLREWQWSDAPEPAGKPGRR